MQTPLILIPRHLATTVMALVQLLDYLQSQGCHLFISGLHGGVAAVLKRRGLTARSVWRNPNARLVQ